MILHATHTHLYPGHGGTVSGVAGLAGVTPGRDCLVEFSDGSAASARLAKSENGWLLHTSVYRTAAGTRIAARRWRLRLRENAECIEFRILEKA